jgi:hypothetical protein
VNLRNLRPRLGADLGQLRDLVQAGGWRSALPEALPDPVLLMLALDFRSVEASFTRAESSDEEVPSLSAALFIVTNLLFQHPARKGDPDGVTLSEDGMVHALRVYQWAIEREILTRITGLPHGGPSLLDELLRCLDD